MDSFDNHENLTQELLWISWMEDVPTSLVVLSLGDFRKAIWVSRKVFEDCKSLRYGWSGRRRTWVWKSCQYSKKWLRKTIEHHEKYSTIAKDLVDKEGEGRGYGNLVNALSSDFWKACGYHKGGLTTWKNWLTGPEEDLWKPGQCFTGWLQKHHSASQKASEKLLYHTLIGDPTALWITNQWGSSSSRVLKINRFWKRGNQFYFTEEKRWDNNFVCLTFYCLSPFGCVWRHCSPTAGSWEKVSHFLKFI